MFYQCKYLIYCKYCLPCLILSVLLFCTAILQCVSFYRPTTYCRSSGHMRRRTQGKKTTHNITFDHPSFSIWLLFSLQLSSSPPTDIETLKTHTICVYWQAGLSLCWWMISVQIQQTDRRRETLILHNPRTLLYSSVHWSEMPPMHTHSPKPGPFISNCLRHNAESSF